MPRATVLLALLLTACGPLNEPPTAPVVQISPGEPTDNDLLVCEIVTEASDADGDELTYTYAWSVNGDELGVVDEDPSFVPGEQTLVGEEWTCEVYATDYSEDGPAARDSVTIGPEI
jgi:hypothetical protein